MDDTNSSHIAGDELAALREEALKFAGIGIYRCSTDGTIRFIDAGALRILDLEDVFPDPRTVSGKRMSGLIASGGCPDRLRRKISEYKRLRGFEYRIRTLKGVDKWVEEDSFLTRDPATDEELIQAIIRDVTARKQAELDRQEAQRARATLMSNLPGMAYRCCNDEEWTMEFVSEGCFDLTGYQPGELVESLRVSYASLIHPDDRDQVWKDVQAALSRREPFELIYRIHTAGGAERWVLEKGLGVFSSAGQLLAIEGFISDVTQHKLAEEALQREKDFDESVLQTAQAIILVLDMQGRIVRFNPYFEEITGYRFEEVKDKDWFSTFLPKRDREHIREVFSEAVHNIDTRGNVNPILTKDGRERQIEWYSKTLKDAKGNVVGLLATGQDITERLQMTEELRLAKFSIDHSSTGTFWIGPDAQFLYVNDATCKALGYSREELLTMSVPDIDPEFPAEKWPGHWEALRGSGSLTFESIHQHKDGTTFPVEITGNYVEFDGTEYIFAFARDISHRKRGEEHRRQLEAHLHQDQKMESLGALARGIAHDFGNLLTGIISTTDLAMMELAPDSPVVPLTERIRTAALHACELTDQILAYSGQETVMTQPVRLGELMEEMTGLLKTSVSDNVTLRLESPREVPPIAGDPTQIRRVIRNLVSNASDALGGAGGTVSICLGTLDVDANYLASSIFTNSPAEGLYAYAEVADTGPGMDESTQAKIFDPFFTTKRTGRGLGLSVVQGIVRSHNGVIHLDSQLGAGSRFTILLPVIVAD